MRKLFFWLFMWTLPSACVLAAPSNGQQASHGSVRPSVFVPIIDVDAEAMKAGRAAAREDIAKGELTHTVTLGRAPIPANDCDCRNALFEVDAYKRHGIRSRLELSSDVVSVDGLRSHAYQETMKEEIARRKGKHFRASVLREIEQRARKPRFRYCTVNDSARWCELLEQRRSTKTLESPG